MAERHGDDAGRWRTGEPLFVEDVEGSSRPAVYYLAESRDGLYVPYVVRMPADEGRFPFIFLGYGNGGGGIGWLRLAPIDLPILVMGRDGDHLQGIFRVSYELLEEDGKDTEWVSWDHPLHGYLFPSAADGDPGPDQVQESAVDKVIAFLDRHLKPRRAQGDDGSGSPGRGGA